MLLVAALSVMFVVGVWFVASPPTTSSVQLDPQQLRRLASRSAGSLGIGMVTLVTSGWLAPALVLGLGAFVAIGNWQRRDRHHAEEVARLDALASWIENVRDVMLAGEQPVGAITSSVVACSPPIKPHVRRLAAGLARHDPEIAFRRFADDIDDPLADLVAAGLAIALRRGARTVPVLSSLAEQTREQVERRRLIEAERAPTRREVMALTGIMGTLVVLLLGLGRSSYLDAYDTVGGQAFLGLMLALYVGLLVRVQRLAAFPRPARFLSAGGVS